MNRREFFFYFAGWLVVTGVTRSCYTPKTKFPPEEILEIDRQGVVHPWKPNFMLSYDIKTRTILECKVE